MKQIANMIETDPILQLNMASDEEDHLIFWESVIPLVPETARSQFIASCNTVAAYIQEQRLLAAQTARLDEVDHLLGKLIEVSPMDTSVHFSRELSSFSIVQSRFGELKHQASKATSHPM